MIWAQTVGAVDVISGRSGSPALIAAIQTAISLPGVLLALLAGAVADIVDRRRMLIAAGGLMVAAMGTLAALTVADLATAPIVLAATATLGAGLAMFLPAFSAMVPDLVPRPMLIPAIAITGVSVNIARAAGPAVAGGVIAIAGAGGLFWLLTVVLGLVVLTLVVVGPASTRPERPERIGEAVRAGTRYVRHSAPLRMVILRTGLFVAFGSALWAMLPIVANRRLGFDASGFGLLLGCVGIGAVAGAVVLPRIRRRLALDHTVAAGSVALAAVLAALSVVESRLLGGLILLAAGAAWISVLTGLLGAAQAVTPGWVRGRALSAWLLTYQGGLALGSVAWGILAESSLEAALLVPAGALVLTALGSRLYALDIDEHTVIEPSGSWGSPTTTETVGDEEGPVLVSVEYDIAEDDIDDFVNAMRDVEAIRRRDGARNWDLYRDLALPGRLVESFTVSTWAEHLRQHERATNADAPLERQAAAFVYGYTVRHLVAVRRPRG